jgi:hypothetical protein
MIRILEVNCDQSTALSRPKRTDSWPRFRCSQVCSMDFGIFWISLLRDPHSLISPKEFPAPVLTEFCRN